MFRTQPKYLFAITFSLILGSAAFIPADLSAEIYSYTDENGVLHFSNAPTSSKYRYAGPEISMHTSIYYPGSRINAYDDIIREASLNHGMQFELIKAMIHAESSFNPNAISKSGAIGLMQIMPENLNAFGISDPFDPRDNVMGGTRYLKQLMKKYNSDVSLSLAAYNAGPSVVDKYNDIPPFPETENYVEKVLTYYSLYRNQHP
ncbi:MAG: transglycosylase SLT domain-containing protein [Desulfobacteraceae bacterium]|nr:transglycosylase SLT domain-containing protein [Desulfobacteraceae bacterium]MBC2755585.1 transglycosylase SLT domain-containing protein [Desulfobacteraceae bacterium]